MFSPRAHSPVTVDDGGTLAPEHAATVHAIAAKAHHHILLAGRRCSITTRAYTTFDNMLLCTRRRYGDVYDEYNNQYNNNKNNNKNNDKKNTRPTRSRSRSVCGGGGR